MKLRSIIHTIIDLFVGCGGLSLGMEQAPGSAWQRVDGSHAEARRRGDSEPGLK